MTQEELVIFADMFEKNTKKGEDGDCWIWQGRTQRDRECGVMRIYRNHHNYFIAAHRWSYRFYNNVSLSDYQIIAHTCGIDLCVNPTHLEVGKQGIPSRNQRDLFMERVSIQENGCWVWTGHTSHGYGSVVINKKSLRAHRVSYELFKGAIPEGLVIDHLCRNTACVNPDHLEAVTTQENVLRGLRARNINPKTSHKRDNWLVWKRLYQDLFKEVYGDDEFEQKWRQDVKQRRKRLGL